MGKQHNKVQKRVRRKSYLKRKVEAAKAQIALGKKPASKKKASVAQEPAEEGAQVAVEAPKKAPAKKAAAKKATTKKAATKKAPAKKAAPPADE